MYELKLPETITISSCDEQLNKVLELKSSQEKIQIDFSDVDTIDTAGVQFILSLCSDINQVTCVGVTDVIKESLIELGLPAI